METLMKGLTCFLYEVQKSIAALIAIQNNNEVYSHGKISSPFMDICEQAIEQYLLSLLSKIFDKEITCGHSNCCLLMLKNKCCDLNVDKELINQIDELIKEYETTISYDIRNKRIAHFDFSSIEEGKFYTIDFEALVELVNSSCDVLTKLSEQVCWGDIVFPEIERLVASIEEGFPFNDCLSPKSKG